MGDLLIRNIPEALRADIEALARRKGQSLSEAAREALRAGVAAVGKATEENDRLPAGDRLKAIFAGVFESDDEAEAFQKELEAMRRNDIGRPVPDFE
ncbi:ribbon-helix-helix protein, CopG family [Oryzicola mucosus]|uniref:Ribbon-helix-helix protein, CopG family n=1 Tax=Oryzicola mucosus TaxID=2767425 RepID=A0A8J6PEH9_9HYPH|nr:ribbon-helix-helix protein, CopG family [Oryzicola mucosus]MBD0413359.1 ribbon-helix-helix protein, CopG family [Oryzicola mucosus]